MRSMLKDLDTSSFKWEDTLKDRSVLNEYSKTPDASIFISCSSGKIHTQCRNTNTTPGLLKNKG